jgi:1-aminocyclopropane-1-carboxylate deaminase
VATVAAHLGLKCTIVPNSSISPSYLSSAPPTADSPSSRTLFPHTGNVQIASLLGADIRPVDTEVQAVLKELQDAGERPYLIPSGGSLLPRGGLGFAAWALELSAWEQEHYLHFDVILVACATGSTLAGMVAGFALAKQKGTKPAVPRSPARQPLPTERRVIGIEAFTKDSGTQLGIARSTAQLIGLQELDISEEDIVLDTRFNGGAYGKLDEKTEEAIRLMAESEGVVVDPIYTGKMVAAVVEMLRSGELDGRGNVLCVHTGGLPAVFGYPELR